MPKGTIMIVLGVVLVALAITAVVLLGPWSREAPQGQSESESESKSESQSEQAIPQEPSSAAPVITGIDFPEEIEADGRKVPGTVHFRDKDGDIVQVKFDVVEAKLFEPFSFDPKVRGQSEGSFKFVLFTVFPQKVTLRVTLVDAQGNESEPVEFSFEAVLPQP